MGNEWKEARLSDIVDFIGGGTPKRNIPEYWGGTIPWLSVKDFNNEFRYVDSAEESITDLGLQKSSTNLLLKGQLIISARGTVGALAQLHTPMAFNQSCYGINANPEYTTNDFLYYFIKYSVANIKQLTHGAVFDTITRETFDHIIVKLPRLLEQRSIAHILGSLDDKINLNRKMNETLEAMAQALFKSWFVDFDPVIDNALAAGKSIPKEFKDRVQQRKNLGDARKSLPKEIQKLFPNEFIKTEEMGWIPKGWGIDSLGNITTELRRGISPKYIEHGGIQVINQRCIRNHLIDFSVTRRNDERHRKTDGKLLEIGDLLINSTGVGTLGRMAQVLYLHEPAVVDSHVTVIRSNSKKIKSYLFSRLMFSMESIIEGMGQGSTGQTELSRIDLSNLKILIPSPDIQMFSEKQFKEQAQKIKDNAQQTDVLKKLRDLLLPKLLSGELCIIKTGKLLSSIV